MPVSVLCQDWTECLWGGEPGAQPAHYGCGEGGDGRWEKEGGTPVRMVHQTKLSGSRSSCFHELDSCVLHFLTLANLRQPAPPAGLVQALPSADGESQARYLALMPLQCADRFTQ